jgi:hypothetical protein
MTDNSEQAMLTTVDNPFSPFDNYQEWYEWDRSAGYHTPGLLARIAKISNNLSDADRELAIRQAMDEIANYNVSGMHKLVTRSAS